jgi:hypothetical protein
VTSNARDILSWGISAVFLTAITATILVVRARRGMDPSPARTARVASLITELSPDAVERTLREAMRAWHMTQWHATPTSCEAVVGSQIWWRLFGFLTPRRRRPIWIEFAIGRSGEAGQTSVQVTSDIDLPEATNATKKLIGRSIDQLMQEIARALRASTQTSQSSTLGASEY